MSLRYAVLAALLDGEMTGYDLARLFNISVANFWHALPQQIYAELPKLEADGLVTSRTVVQETRPNKRLYTLSDKGAVVLSDWIASPTHPASLKDELLVRVYAAEPRDYPALARAIEERRADHARRLDLFRAVEAGMLQGATERKFLRESPRVGRFLTLRHGIGYQESAIAWCDWAIAALRCRVETRAEAER